MSPGSWKLRVNQLLVRTTGHHLAAGPPGVEADRLQAAHRRLARAERQRDAAADRADRLQQQLQRCRRRGQRLQAASARAAAAFPIDYDEDVREIITAVRPFTMTERDKLHALIMAVRYVVRHDIPGDVVECGVWRGGSMHAVARTLDALGVHDRELYLFDTFEGMPPPSLDDVRWDGASAERLLASKDRTAAVWAVATLDDVREGFEHVPYPPERVHYVQGLVEQTVPDRAPDTIAILRLDTDWYESTAHELRTLYDRLAPGGVLLIDDYGHWAGSRKATDEFLERTGAPLLLLRMATGRIAVKPWR